MVLKHKKSDLSGRFCLIKYFITRPSIKNRNIIFLPSGQRLWQWVNIWKAPSSGRAEIENIRNSTICDILNFSSATRRHFSNVSTLFNSIYRCLVKNDVFTIGQPSKISYLIIRQIKQHINTLAPLTRAQECSACKSAV